MQISAGFIIIDPCTKNVLACHPTNGSKEDFFSYDIPKGHIEDGEDALAAAKRELKEETGIELPEDLPDDDIYEIGRVTYRSDKKLHLFSLEYKVVPQALHCDSMFVDSFGCWKKENDKFMMTSRADSFFVNMRFHIIHELWRRYGGRLVEWYEGDHPVQSYIPTPRYEGLMKRLELAKDMNKWFPEGEIKEGLDNETVADALVNAKHPSSVLALSANKSSLYEQFDFDVWLSDMIAPI